MYYYNMDSFTFYINCFLSMGIFLVIIYIVYKSFIGEDNYIIESFNDFSPYVLNQNSKYYARKRFDEALLKNTRDFWENNKEGYYNADIGGVPLVPITIFDTMNKDYCN